MKSIKILCYFYNAYFVYHNFEDIISYSVLESVLNHYNIDGKILNARENKLRQSKLYKQCFGDTEAMVKRTHQDVSDFGMYGDCGHSYERA